MGLAKISAAESVLNQQHNVIILNFVNLIECVWNFYKIQYNLVAVCLFYSSIQEIYFLNIVFLSCILE